METILGISVIVLFVGLVANFLVTIALAKRLERMKDEMLSGMGFDEETLEVGTPAPAFEAETTDGRQVTLADFAEKALALVFMSPHCGPCLDKLPSLNELYAKAKAKGVELVLVNVEDDAETTRSFAEKENLQIPMLSAPRHNNPLADAYKAMGTPFYCFINPQGNVESTGFFSKEWDTLAADWSA